MMLPRELMMQVDCIGSERGVSVVTALEQWSNSNITYDQSDWTVTRSFDFPEAKWRLCSIQTSHCGVVPTKDLDQLIELFQTPAS